MSSTTVLYEDNHLIAVWKRSGQTVQPEPGKPVSLEEEVKSFIKKRDAKPGDVFLGVIHRLDMPVSGIVLFAKTSKALTRMNKIFHDREVKKIYEAIVENVPPQQHDTITHWLKRDDKRKLTKAFSNETKGADRATLIYELAEQKKGFHNGRGKSRLRIELLTGRKHQIRAQLSAIGCPIEGDVKYGASGPNPDMSISLSAIELHFRHPVKEEDIHILLP